MSLIVITGIDGIGKTTLVGNLQETFPHYQTKHLLQALDYPGFFRSPTEVLNEMSKCDSLRRLEIVRDGWELCMHNLQPDMILDSYWYKYAAAEYAYGARFDDIEWVFSDLPKPDEVFLLCGSAEKRNKSKYESGLLTPLQGPPVANFVEKYHEGFMKLASAFGPWKSVERVAADELTRKLILKSEYLT